jgi:type IV pilus assembly protein PilB
MEVTEEIRGHIVARASSDAIAGTAVAQGMRRLREDGMAKALAGETSLAEVARVSG